MTHGKLLQHRDTEKFKGYGIMYFTMQCKQGVTSLMYSLLWVGSGWVTDPCSDEYHIRDCSHNDRSIFILELDVSSERLYDGLI